jgi:hypothetical protein
VAVHGNIFLYIITLLDSFKPNGIDFFFLCNFFSRFHCAQLVVLSAMKNNWLHSHRKSCSSSKRLVIAKNSLFNSNYMVVDGILSIKL